MTSVAQIRLAYGVGPKVAAELLGRRTLFARAARYFGPMFCYRGDRMRWALFGELKSREQIIAAKRARAA